MLEMFYPDEYLDSTYSIDFERLYQKGYRGILFDIDNTLVPHGAPADDRAKALFERLRNIGFQCCLISNNQLPRVKPFADEVGALFLEDAHKPSRKGYQLAMKKMGTTTENTLFVGDQLFTDILCGNLCGCVTILVEPYAEEGYGLYRIKRPLEKPLLRLYHRRKRRNAE